MSRLKIALPIIAVLASGAAAWADPIPYFRFNFGTIDKTVGVPTANVNTDQASGMTVVVPCTTCRARARQDFLFQPQSSGAGDYPTWDIVSGGTPPGTSLYSATGVIGGSPGLPGSYPATLRVTRIDGATAESVPFTMVILPSPTIAYASTKGPSNRQLTLSPTLGNVYGNPLFGVVDGAPLPPGLSIDPGTGTISGTVGGSQAGIQVYVKDSDGGTAVSQPFDILTDQPTVAFGSTHYDARVGVPFSTVPTLQSTTAAVRLQLDSGTLPPGLGLNAASGEISGTPQSVGTWGGVVVRVTDAGGTTTSRTLDFTVTAASLSYGNATTWVGQSFSLQPAFASMYGPTFDLSGGSLPAGLGLARDSGIVGGVPSAVGTLSGIVVHAQDPAGGQAYSPGFSIQVLPALTASAPALTKGRVGVPMSVAATAQNFQSAPTWSLSGGQPTGLSVDANAGTLSGTPTAAGSWPGLTFTAAQGGGTVTTNTFAVQVAPAFTLSYPAATTLVRNRPASVPASVAGAISTPSFARTAGTLPAGLSVNSSTGAVEGTPTQATTQSGLAVTATDSAGTAPSSAFAITVADPTATFARATGRVGRPFTQSATSTLLTSPTWNVTGGALPAGVTLAGSTGVVSGTPSAAGTQSGLSLTATGPEGSAASPPVQFTVLGPYSVSIPAGDQSQTTHLGTSRTTGAATVTNGSGTATFSLSTVSGTAPAGARANADGTVTYTPSSPGSWSYAVAATDPDGTSATSQTASVTFTGALSAGAAPSDLSVPPTGTATSTLSATNGSPSVTWSWSGTAPPAWLTLSGTTVTAQPGGSVVPGIYGPYTVTARDSDGSTASATVRVFVNDSRPAVSYASPMSFHVGVTGIYSPTVRNVAGTQSWTQSGTWPAWATLDGSTGKVTGRPTAAGTVSGGTATVRDASSGANGVSQALTFTAVPTPSVSAPTSATGFVGNPLSTTAGTTTNFIGAATWYTSSALPAGVTVDPSTGRLVGTPQQTGNWSVVLAAQDAFDGSTATAPAPLALQILADGPALYFPDYPSATPTIDFGTTTNGLKGTTQQVRIGNRGSKAASSVVMQTQEYNTPDAQKAFTVADPGTCAQALQVGATCTATLKAAGQTNAPHSGQLNATSPDGTGTFAYASLIVTTQNVIQPGSMLFTKGTTWDPPGNRLNFSYRYLVMGGGAPGESCVTLNNSWHFSYGGGSSGYVVTGSQDLVQSTPIQFRIYIDDPRPPLVSMNCPSKDPATGATPNGAASITPTFYSPSSKSYMFLTGGGVAAGGDLYGRKGGSAGGACGSKDPNASFFRQQGPGNPGATNGGNGPGGPSVPSPYTNCIVATGAGPVDLSMFKQHSFTWGTPGAGGPDSGPNPTYPQYPYYFGGSGGGAGLLYDGTGPSAGTATVVQSNPEATQTGIFNKFSGQPGTGYGAGGAGGSSRWEGGDGNCPKRTYYDSKGYPTTYNYCAPDYKAQGGVGAKGMVYIEWDAQ